MARAKALKNLDARLARLNREVELVQSQRKEIINQVKGVVGEAFLNVLPEIPTDRAGCRAFAENVRKLVEAHREEFEAMFPSDAAAEAEDAAQDDDEESVDRNKTGARKTEES